MNNQFGQEPGRFIYTFDRELRNQIADHQSSVFRPRRFNKTWSSVLRILENPLVE